MSSTVVETEASNPGVKSEIQSKEYRKVAWASFIGTSIEWYDFYLYGSSAALIFPALFFPTFDPLYGTIAAFTTYAVGFIARPLGSAVFGHFGDRVGRRNVLMLSLLVMGAATFLIGLLPTHQSIGIGAPLLLSLLRLIQGFAVGGEWGAAVVMTVEHAPPGKRGFYGSFPQLGVPVGLLLSTLVFSLFSNQLSEEAFLAWGWRLPFLLSSLLVLIGVYVRWKLSESPVYLKQRAEQPQVDPHPVRTVWREEKNRCY